MTEIYPFLPSMNLAVKSQINLRLANSYFFYCQQVVTVRVFDEPVDMYVILRNIFVGNDKFE